MDTMFLTFCSFQKTKNFVPNSLSNFTQVWCILEDKLLKSGGLFICNVHIQMQRCFFTHENTAISFFISVLSQVKHTIFFCILIMNEVDCWKHHRIHPCSSLVFWQATPDLIKCINFTYSTDPHLAFTKLDARETGERPVPHHEELTVWWAASQYALHTVPLGDMPEPRRCWVAGQTGGERGRAPREGAASAASWAKGRERAQRGLQGLSNQGNEGHKGRATGTLSLRAAENAFQGPRRA